MKAGLFKYLHSLSYDLQDEKVLIAEWLHLGDVSLQGGEGKCPCGAKNRNYMCRIINRYTKRIEVIGKECIDNFSNHSEVGIMNEIFKVFDSAIKNGYLFTFKRRQDDGQAVFNCLRTNQLIFVDEFLEKLHKIFGESSPIRCLGDRNYQVVVFVEENVALQPGTIYRVKFIPSCSIVQCISKLTLTTVETPDPVSPMRGRSHSTDQERPSRSQVKRRLSYNHEYVLR